MKGLHIFSVALLFLAASCHRPMDTGTPHSLINEPDNNNLIDLPVANGPTCEKIATSIFEKKLVATNSGDANALMYEFNWGSSAEKSKHRVKCYFQQ